MTDNPLRRALESGGTTGPPSPSFGPEGFDIDGRRHRFFVIQEIASGGQGRVLKARDTALERDVALKEVRADRADPEAERRFLAEAQIAGQLEHPGIVPVYEVGVGGDGQPYYVMRLVTGPTLYDAVREFHAARARGEADPTGFRKLMTAFVAVCQAVAYAHDRGVLHRDLKGRNIVLGRFGEAVVLDWGLAKVLAGAAADDDAVAVTDDVRPDESHLGQIRGTPGYMAPEQARGLPDRIGPRTDVYGLGAVLYEILTGRPPIVGRDVREILTRVCDEPPPRPRGFWPEAPPAVEAICLRALAKEPEARYESAAEVAEEIGRWMGDEPVRAYPDSWIGKVARWGRRHKSAVRAAIAFLTLATVVFAVSTVLIFRAKQEADRASAQLGQALDRLASVTADVEGKAEALPYAERAVATFRDLHAAAPDAPPATRNLASALQNLSLFVRDVKDLARAEALCREALALRRSLADAHPGEPLYRHDLASTINTLATLRQATGRLEAARDGYREAAGLWDTLAKADVANLDYRRSLAAATHNLGLAESGLGQFGPAQAAFERSAEVRKALVAAAPHVLSYRYDLVFSHGELARLHGMAGRNKEALREGEEAARQAESLAARNPDVSRYRALLANVLNNVAIAYRALGQEAKEEGALLRARDLRRALAADFPREGQYKSDLAVNLALLAQMEQRRDRPAAAESLLGEAHTLLEEWHRAAPDNAEAAVRLGDVRNDLGNLAINQKRLPAAREWWEKADAVLVGVLEKEPRNAVARATRGYALFGLAAVAAQQGRFDDALKALREARRLGLFSTPEGRQVLANEKALDALRDRDDFKEFVAEVTRAAAAPPK